MKQFKSLIAALLIVILALTMSVSTFAYSDVDPTSENLVAIEFVDRLGIIPSTWTGEFQPEQYFTRADLVKAAYRMLYGADIDPTLYESNTLEFTVTNSGDVEDGSVLAAYLTWAVDNYLVTTNVGDSKFRPAEPVTANEFLTVLAKIMRLVEDPEATYPDDYTSALSEVIENIEAGESPVTREQAAVAIANALVAEEDGTPGQIGVYRDYDGNKLTSIASKYLCMTGIDLVIRATVSRPLGYEVKNGVLLSNGMDVDLGQDLSEYVGYGITLTYQDTDSSETLTEDEKILAFSIGSASSATVTFSDVEIVAGNSLSVKVDSSPFAITTSTYVYLNDAPWPVGNDYYDLVKFSPSLGTATSIKNRPNFKFKCMYSADSTSLTSVFASETIPAKVVGINNGVYYLYDYYRANTENPIVSFEVTDCVFTKTVKFGDYVNYYESNGKCYISEATTKLDGIKEVLLVPGSETELVCLDESSLFKHAFFKFGMLPAKERFEQPEIPEEDKDKFQPIEDIVFILDDSGENYLITWEPYKVNYRNIFITGMVDMLDDKGNKLNRYAIGGYDVSTDDFIKFEVMYQNIQASEPLAVGDFITVSTNGARADRKIDEKTNEEQILYTYFVEKSASKTFDYTLTVNGIVDIATGTTYTLSQICNNDVDPTGTAKVLFDMAGNVVKIIQQ